MTQILSKELSIGEIVVNDFRTTSVFKEAGIDFCCGGKKTLSQACLEKGIDQTKLKYELNRIETLPANHAQNFGSWKLDFLCDYIVNSHHNYVSQALPELVAYTQKIALVHGEKHPELIEVSKLFAQINTELLQHLKKEEEVLFPAIKEVIVKNSIKAKETIISEIARMSGEHEFAGGAMDKINIKTHGYNLPSDACNTYQVTFKLLQQFEDDLHIHVHLENNILYPKALSLTH